MRALKNLPVLGPRHSRDRAVRVLVRAPANRMKGNSGRRLDRRRRRASKCNKRAGTDARYATRREMESDGADRPPTVEGKSHRFRENDPSLPRAGMKPAWAGSSTIGPAGCEKDER